MQPVLTFREMLLSYRSAKVFTLENFPLDCRRSGICTIGSIYKADPFCHLRINSDIHIFLCNTGLCTWLILLVNVNNPFKKSVHTYQQIDSVLIVYVSLFCTSILGINIGSSYGTTCVPPGYERNCVTLSLHY